VIHKGDSQGRVDLRTLCLQHIQHRLQLAAIADEWKSHSPAVESEHNQRQRAVVKLE
jgi:hypothetical protein